MGKIRNSPQSPSKKCCKKANLKKKGSNNMVIDFIHHNQNVDAGNKTHTQIITSIMNNFPSDVVLCSLCKLPGNAFPGLGDLFGPCKPSYMDLLQRYECASKTFEISSPEMTNFQQSSEESEIHFHHTSCYILAPKEQKRFSVSTDATSVKELKISIQHLAPAMQMEQTMDNILLQSDKKRYSTSSNRKFRIQGFTGLLKFTSPNESSKSKQVPNISTVIVVEPTIILDHVTIDYPKREHIQRRYINLDEGRIPLAKSCSSSSVQICHKFDMTPIWVHSACAVGSPDVFAVQGRLFGIWSTVQKAQTNLCAFCLKKGATISRLGNQHSIYHYPCSLASGLSFDFKTFMINQ